MTLARLKLARAPASVLVATLAARTFGHTVGGILTGLPLIAGTITAVLLTDHDAATAAAMARATIAVIPAALCFVVTYAWLVHQAAAAERRWPRAAAERPAAR